MTNYDFFCSDISTIVVAQTCISWERRVKSLHSGAYSLVATPKSLWWIEFLFKPTSYGRIDKNDIEYD